MAGCGGGLSALLMVAGGGLQNYMVVIACRKCHDLAYPSQNENYAFRNLTQAQEIHRKLEGNLDWWGDLPPHKPKGCYPKNIL